MKTIRHNTFETNSSSSHSLTIQKIVLESYDSITDGSRIYPNRLEYTSAWQVIPDVDVGRTITAESAPSKIALLVRCLAGIDQYAIDDLYNFEAEDFRSLLVVSFMKTVWRELGWEIELKDLVPIDFAYDNSLLYEVLTDVLKREKGSCDIVEVCDLISLELLKYVKDDSVKIVDEYYHT